MAATRPALDLVVDWLAESDATPAERAVYIARLGEVSRCGSAARRMQDARAAMVPNLALARTLQWLLDARLPPRIPQVGNAVDVIASWKNPPTKWRAVCRTTGRHARRSSAWSWDCWLLVHRWLQVEAGDITAEELDRICREEAENS